MTIQDVSVKKNWDFMTSVWDGFKDKSIRQIQTYPSIQTRVSRRSVSSYGYLQIFSRENPFFYFRYWDQTLHPIKVRWLHYGDLRLTPCPCFIVVTYLIGEYISVIYVY